MRISLIFTNVWEHKKINCFHLVEFSASFSKDKIRGIWNQFRVVLKIFGLHCHLVVIWSQLKGGHAVIPSIISSGRAENLTATSCEIDIAKVGGHAIEKSKLKFIDIKELENSLNSPT